MPVDGMMWLDDWALVSEFLWVSVWEVGSPASGWDDVAGWWGVGGERGSPFIVKYEAFCWWELQLRHLCWWEFEPCLLIGQDMKAEPCILIGQSWIMHSDWSEHDDWKCVNWTVNCDWSELEDWKSELNHELWLVRTWWVNPASWLAKTNYVLIKLLYTMYLEYLICIYTI